MIIYSAPKNGNEFESDSKPVFTSKKTFVEDSYEVIECDSSSSLNTDNGKDHDEARQSTKLAKT